MPPPAPTQPIPPSAPLSPRQSLPALLRLSWWLVKAQIRTRRTASLLSMLAIALGVALGYAIHLINAAALGDFSQAMKRVQGEPDFIVAPGDSAGQVPLALIEALARDPGVAVVAPVIETRVRVPGIVPPVRLIGLDPFSAATVMPKLLPAAEAETATESGADIKTATEPAAAATEHSAPASPSGSAGKHLFDGAVFASPGLRARLALPIGAPLTLARGDRQWTAPLGGELPAAPDELLLVADIAWVQAHFGPADGVGEGRLRLSPDTRPEVWRADWASRLPPGLSLRAADDDSRRISNLSRAYRVNLNVLALVALLTGAFLVFATQLTAVAQRSTQFALLGVLGLPPRLRQAQVLLEGMAIGLPGALLGLLLGYALAVAFTRWLGGDLGGGYFAATAPSIAPAPLPSLAFLALGCAASLAGALYPAWLNRRQPLAQALKTGFTATPGKVAGTSGRRLAVLALLALGTLGLARMPPLFDLPLAGYAAIALVLALGVAATPPLSRLLFAGMARRSLPAPQRVAVQNLLQAPLMAQVATSGLIVSFALTVSMVTMVSSFRLAVDDWLDDVLPAPLYLRSKGVPLPPALLAAIDRPDSPFARVQRGAVSQLTLDARRPAVALLVREISPNADRAGERLPLTGPSHPVPPGRLAVWISEPLQEIHRLAPGQTVRLPLLGREVEATVAGVWRDYARQFGALVISEADYRALGGRFEPSELALWPRPGQERAAHDWLAAQALAHGLEMAELGELRALSLRIFDQSFAVTYALEAAAMLIGLFGLAVTLAASVWLRARELAMLGALGFDRAMLTRAVLFEGGLITGLGLVIGLACGIAVGALLTHVINPQAFHWRMPLVVPWLPVLAGAALTLLAGLAASRFAARLATRLPAAQVLANVQ